MRKSVLIINKILEPILITFISFIAIRYSMILMNQRSDLWFILGAISTVSIICLWCLCIDAIFNIGQKVKSLINKITKEIK